MFNGNKECNVEFGTESDAAYHRAQIYLDLLNFFNLHPEYHLGCSKMGPFPEEGSASHAQYFTKGVKANSCDLVTFPTAYSLYNRNDYKRCVCDSWFMNEGDCIMGTPGDKEKLPKTKDGKTDKQRQSEKEAAFDKKRDTPRDEEKPRKAAVPTHQPEIQEGAQTRRETTKADVHQPSKDQ